MKLRNPWVLMFQKVLSMRTYLLRRLARRFVIITKGLGSFLHG